MSKEITNLHANTAKVCTIYFDGACPLCAKEIATYQNWQGAERIEWIDASRCADIALGTQLERTQALAKLHARDENGMLVSGAAAFVMMWRQLPALKWITPFLGQAWMIRALDYLYEGFLKIRPLWRKPVQ
ncbi:thiol-disulfide oxidoreductase DCC family protein [Undibacterium sp. Ji22W]|uniref:thiol-disulfide oxidoreductase DCC family protein n=1 Tax=Undibacterium sp. Ji22W TaxID=3413038 RepID=UPI003BF16B6D